MSFLSKLFGDPNKKYVQKNQVTVDKINSLEPEIKKLSDAKLKEKTAEFRDRLKKGEKLDDILPESFAYVREASRRTTGMRHFDVQLLGGIALHQGRIVEMRTGEGKTLVATLSLSLNALTGKGCHLVTVNDYLSRRDCVWMGQIYYALGLSCGCINNDAAYIYDPTWQEKEAKEHDAERDQMGSFKVFHEYLRPVERQEAYRADITYGTNNEFGFDYLRDNMVHELSQMVQRDLYYAIVDEVDSILIDEARTPLIISAPAEESGQLYQQFARLIPRLRENEDYNIDEKMRAVVLTEKGITKMEQMLGVKNIYEESGTDYVHHLEQALKAQALFHRDKDYVVKDGEIIIVDEFTGRLLPGRRYSEGLHQAIEAKEGVEVKKESQTLATVTFQNYFRLYKKLAGMTGTAVTSAEEFANVYKVDVVVVPTNKTMIREDLNDRIYKTELGKFKAVAQEVKARHERGQPVLIGTTSIEKNERLSEMLSREGVPYQLLNAKNHEKEAQIIAQAGRLGAVTCATNMAGRGVDIVLGGNPKNEEEARKIVGLGGLHVIGTERHEARRIDNQLRGRSGRQGDPGSTQFYVSLEDDLMRIFGGDRIKGLMDTLRVPEDQPIENMLVSRSIESAQSKVEANNFDLRKHVLEYDDVMNKHREVIYKRRREIIEAWENESSKFKVQSSKRVIPSDPDVTSGESRDLTAQKTLKTMVFEMIENEIEQIVSKHATGDIENWNVEEIFETMQTIFSCPPELHGRLDQIKQEGGRAMDGVRARTKMIDYLLDLAKQTYSAKEKQVMPQIMRQIERAVMLRSIDNLWIDHLDAMSALREGIGLRGYGQQDPLVEYKKEAFLMFQKLLDAIQNQVVYSIYKVTVSIPAQSVLQRRGVRTSGAKKEESSGGGAGVAQKKVGRNDPCLCGATKPDGTPIKYKHCHGKNI